MSALIAATTPTERANLHGARHLLARPFSAEAKQTIGQVLCGTERAIGVGLRTSRRTLKADVVQRQSCPCAQVGLDAVVGGPKFLVRHNLSMHSILRANLL